MEPEVTVERLQQRGSGPLRFADGVGVAIEVTVAAPLEDV